MSDSVHQKAIAAAPAGDARTEFGGPRTTIVFACDVKKFERNPFDLATPFGRPETIAIGDICEQRDELLAALQAITDLCKRDPANPFLADAMDRIAIAAIAKAGCAA